MYWPQGAHGKGKSSSSGALFDPFVTNSRQTCQELNSSTLARKTAMNAALSTRSFPGAGSTLPEGASLRQSATPPPRVRAAGPPPPLAALAAPASTARFRAQLGKLSGLLGIRQKPRAATKKNRGRVHPTGRGEAGIGRGGLAKTGGDRAPGKGTTF